MFGVGLDIGVVGLAWWALAGVALFGVFAAGWVREGSGHEILLEDEEEVEETASASSTNGERRRD